MSDYCRLVEVLKDKALSDTTDEIVGLRCELGLGVERDNQQLNQLRSVVVYLVVRSREWGEENKEVAKGILSREPQPSLYINGVLVFQ
jgi:hypothetical protein